MKTLVLLTSLLFFLPGKASAECEASVFLRDWAGGFKTSTEAFDFCFSRAIGYWGLDDRDWKTRYCQLQEDFDYYDGEYRRTFSILFLHNARNYSARYPSSIFFAIENDFRRRVHNGFVAKIQINFSESCGNSDY